MKESLYKQIGGEDAVIAAVNLFYEKVLADELLAPFFDGMNIVRIKQHQVSFFTAILGGFINYTGRDLRDAHKGLVKEKGLSDIHFDRILMHLENTLLELGIDQKTTTTLTEVIESLRQDVLDK